MKSITVFNNKGGVGKTTFLCNLASYLSIRKNKKVLLIDADPQCNATSYILDEERLFKLYEKNSGTVNDIIQPLKKGKGYYEKDYPILKSSSFRIDILAGDPKLALSEDFLAADWIQAKSGDARGLQTTLLFFDLLNKSDKYDFIFFDVGPSLGAINRTVLLGCDYFMVPMSSDIFSLKAINNISISLSTWKRDLQNGLQKYAENEEEDFKVDDANAEWKLQFLGYITQQYTAKTEGGQKRPVKAYDRIISKIPALINSELLEIFTPPNIEINAQLGEIPNLHSLVPLSQSSNVPIFALKSEHGVVGAHFSKVREYEKILSGITSNFLNNIRELE